MEGIRGNVDQLHDTMLIHSTLVYKLHYNFLLCRLHIGHSVMSSSATQPIPELCRGIISV